MIALRSQRMAGAFLMLSAVSLSGCASFPADIGFSVVSDLAAAREGKEAIFARSQDEAKYADDTVKRLLSRPLTADDAVQVALLNNKGLQAAYAELALAQVNMVEESLPPTPTFSVSAIAGDGANEIERQVVGNILALATLPLRSDIARERFRRAQLKAALATLRLAADVRRTYYKAIGTSEMAALLTDANATAKSTATLATKLGETGSLNKLDQAREQVFYAETATDLAHARQEASSFREKLARLMGAWGDGLSFRIPARLPMLPKKPLSLPSIEVDAVAHRLDLQIARMEVVALAKSLDLTTATRFVTLLDVAGIDRRTLDPQGAPFRERGFDVQFQIPVWDGGETRVRQSSAIYDAAFNRLAKKAVDVRSEARDAYLRYRSAYDIASHYQREVLPLRNIIAEEMQLRLSQMQDDVFALLAEARQRTASQRAAIDAKRDFFLAQAELHDALNGGSESEPAIVAQAADSAN